MFDLASAHHQFHLQENWQETNTNTNTVEYQEPKDRSITKSLKSRFLSRKQLSQRKLFNSTPVSTPVSSMRRSTTAGSKLMVKRLTHYTSMADALMKKSGDADDKLNCSNKENQTPNTTKQNYR